MMLQFKIPLLAVVLLAVNFADFSSAQPRCQYAKFTPYHTYCKPSSPYCNMLHSGLNDSEKALLLHLHNQFRNKVALGREGSGGGLPPAADMLQMVWDDELAAIAQKLAEQCKMEHDCGDCRRVDRFSVGQNLFQMFTTGRRVTREDLKSSVEIWYKEVDDFSKNVIPSFTSTGKVTGHFTQIIWSESWRLGCGSAVYKGDGTWTNLLIACNYGPAGNVLTKPIYKSGKTCSSCPQNSSCTKTCSKFNRKYSYPGLCKMIK